MGNFKLDGRTIGIIIFLIIAAVIFLPRLFGGGNDADNRVNEPVNEPLDEPVDERDTTINQDDGIELGNVVAATSVNRDGCASNVTNSFDPNDPVYVVAEDSDVTEGTEVFVRFYYEDEVYEESDVIVADQDYENTCISFTLEPDELDQLRSGSYEAEFIINGNPADVVAFEVE